MTGSDERVFPYRLGRILRAHGLAGDLLLQLFRARPVTSSRLKSRKASGNQEIELYWDDGRFEVRTLRAARFLDPSRVVLTVDGLTDRTEAEALAGAFVDVDPKALPVLLVDEVDRAFGARVRNEETGDFIGEVTAIRDNGAQALLLVGEAQDIMIPWVEAFIAGVDDDPDGPIVRVRPIPGLFEVNREP